MEEQLQEGVPQEEVKVEETPTNEDKSPMSYEDGVIKVDLAELNKTQENTAQEQKADVVITD